MTPEQAIEEARRQATTEEARNVIARAEAQTDKERDKIERYKRLFGMYQM